MYQSDLFPLRTIVGDSIPIKGKQIRKVFESDASRQLEIEYGFIRRQSFSETASDPVYLRYLPTVKIGDIEISPSEGMGLLPTPFLSRPFGPDEFGVSFFALSTKETNDDVSRKLSATFSIQLPARFLIGGICFGGHPYLPYDRIKLEREGINSSNFGLPREVRLSCSGNSSPLQGFLDAENSATTQEIISHSGFHYLCIDPTSAETVAVHFSDYPTILVHEERDEQGALLVATSLYGFLIPDFYIFEYREQTRYRAFVPAGLLGVSTNADTSEQWSCGSTDYRHLTGFKTYCDFTAASMFGRQRQYQIDRATPETEMRECYISGSVQPNKNVVLYVEQGEEYARCIAGIKLFLPFVPEVSLTEDIGKITEWLQGLVPDAPDFGALVGNLTRDQLEEYLRLYLRIPDDINFCEKIGVRIYELDPLEGVSPVNVALDGKYATLLAETEIDEPLEILSAFYLDGLRFERPSNSRFFAIELINKDDQAGRFVIESLQLIQSAHVSVHPRAAKTQQVRALNFRIIGSELAEDYSFLGNDGFNFSIERFIAGERKSVLFRANSLLDLLHTGAAKIFSNVRRRSVEEETSDIIGGASENFERRHLEVMNDGWRKSETGHKVKGKDPWEDFDTYFYNRRDPGRFENVSNAETRTHTELISPQDDVSDWASNALLGNAMFAIRRSGFSRARAFYEQFNNAGFFNQETIERALGIERILIPTYHDVRLYSGFDYVWRGIIDAQAPEGNAAHKNSLRIEGVKSVTSSPFGINSLTAEFFDFINALSAADFEDMLLEATDFASLFGLTFLTQGRIFALSAANSLSAGISIAPAGLGFTFSASTSGGLLLPSYTYVNSFGTQGTITKQASRSGYNYSQFLNESFDESDSRSGIQAARSHRRIQRRAIEGGDRDRTKGAEVMWQGKLADIITGSIPLNLTLPATATKAHFRTSDDSLRVRFGSGVGRSVSVDVWFDLIEEIVKDDY